MAFIATFKTDYDAEIKKGFSISFEKDESFKLLDSTDLFYIIDLEGSTPIGIRKEFLTISGTGVEWYADSFHQLYKDKISWKKRFRMHIVIESEPFTYEINMRLLNDKWEYTEVNQYTNGTDANKLGEVTDESIKQMLVFLLKEDEKFEKMIKETKRQIGLIAKVSNSDFEVKEVETIESPYYRNEVRLKVKLANETDYWFSFLYNPKSQKFEYGYLISRHSSYNLKGIMDDNFKSKILSYPNFEDIVLSKTS